MLYQNEEWLRQKYEKELLTSAEIAKITNAQPSNICYFLRKFKIKTRDTKKPRAVYKNRKWLIKEYVIDKLSIGEIAKLTNVSKSVIAYWMGKNNIQTRSKSEGMKITNKNPSLKRLRANTEHSEWMKGRQHSLGIFPDLKTRQKMKKSHHRKDISREIYGKCLIFRYENQIKFNIWRWQVLDAKGTQCKICGVETDRCHHLEEVATNLDKAFDVENGMPMCKSCHQRFHQWVQYKKNTAASKLLYIEWKDKHNGEQQ